MRKEALEGFRYDGLELIIDVTGGGVVGLFPRGILANVAASRLRRLADDLERNVAKRAAPETSPVPMKASEEQSMFDAVLKRSKETSVAICPACKSATCISANQERCANCGWLGKPNTPSRG